MNLFFLLIFSRFCFSEWELVQGNPESSNKSFSIYEGEGFQPKNRPGGRFLPGVAQVNSTSVFLHGGGGYHLKGEDDFLCDLWEYNGEKNMWQFLKGGLDFGGYDTGKWSYSFDESNYPSGRRSSFIFPSPSRTTRFFMFGGYPFNSQLWEYDIVLNQFRVNTGIYYEENYNSHSFDNVNKLPGRSEGSYWVNEENQFLYVFGGAGYHGDYNDMWVLDLQTNEWRWIRGPNCVTQPDSPGYYGELDMYDNGNDPPSRYGMAYWKHDDEFYFFGGRSWKRQDFFNDVWSFHMTNETWRWRHGENANSVNYTSWSENIFTDHAFDPFNVPTQRRNSYFWEIGDSMMLFGGDKFDHREIYIFGDLWEYNATLNMFRCKMFCGGWNETRDRVYNSSEPHVISGRSAGGSFKDNEGNLALFSGYFAKNDLWVWDGVPKCRNISIYETDWLCSGHGACENDECVCDIKNSSVTCSDYYGSDCDRWFCYGEPNFNNSQSVCSGHGICSSADHCDCFIYEGHLCDKFTCFSHSANSETVCNNHAGRCTSLDHCECLLEDYYGTECQEKISGAEKIGVAVRVSYFIPKSMVQEDDIYHYFECDDRVYNIEDLGKDPRCLWTTDSNDKHYLQYLDVYLGDKHKLHGGDDIIIRPISTPDITVSLEIEEHPFRFPFEVFSVFILFFCCACCYCYCTVCICCCFCVILGRNIHMTTRLHRQIRLYNMLEKPETP